MMETYYKLMFGFVAELIPGLGQGY